ncbi:alpha/beta hydrolase [Mycobacterium hubeiense]|uniref:alpha/beta hydrolase n=1 Tax=Mycobacterium hubeiense TaxID=1867256 RepID=UPI000C7E9FB5|nr:alpha/beta hydrolase [Mycobacterium sp. QGD 101]
MSSVDFHPELARSARFIPRRLVTPWTLPVFQRLTRLQGRRLPKGVEVLTLTNGVGVRLYRPSGADGRGPGLLWIHGGGYVIGTAAQDDRLCRRFADELGATVASVEYRLAPQHPYPAGLEDCYSALKWLAKLPAVDPARLAIGGASAGGGLAAALALLARDRGEVPVAAQLLVYPMLDDRAVGRELDHAGHRLWTHTSNQFGWSAYLGNADPAVAVPARREDLAGLPPAWIGVGTLDLFHDEDLEYAERLKAAGVPCQVEVVSGAFHGFDQIVAKAEVSRAFVDSQCAWLRDAFTANDRVCT